MRASDRLFPYPVLNCNPLNTQYIDTCVFSLNLDKDDIESVSEEGLTHLKNLSVTLTSQYLLDLVNSGKAKIVCVFECPASLYRENFEIFLYPIDKTFTSTDLNGRCYLTAYISMREDMDNYSSDEFVDEYRPHTFQIEKNDIVAISETLCFSVSYESQDSYNSSFFIVSRNSELDTDKITIDTQSDKIHISLSSETYDFYDRLKDKHPEYFYSVLGIPSIVSAITSALCEINNDDSESETSLIEELSSYYTWFPSLESQFKKKYGRDMKNSDLSNLYPALEDIFDCPIGKSIREMSELRAQMSTDIGGETYEQD